MDDSLGEGGSIESTVVDGWLAPLGDPPCGEDIEYDNAFAVDLALAVAGKPATQFDEAVPPNWREARSIAESLFERTRDLRVAVAWARAMVCLEGASTLPDSLRLIHGLLETWWDDLHPKPDDGDAYARINTLADMCTPAGLLGDLRQSLIIDNRSIGELRGREVEIALGLLEARPDEMPPTRESIQHMLRDAVESQPALRDFPQRCVDRLNAIAALMQDRVGYGAAPDLQPLITLMEGLAGLMPAAEVAEESSFDATAEDAGDGEAESRPRRRASGGGLGSSIDTREDALRAIDMVCEFLERTEPTNPAPLFLRRARKLVNKNFIELVRELAPESLDQVARLVGLSADEISQGSSYE